VLVSHRPSLIRGVDKVLVMRDGAAELFGPRADVLARLGARPIPPSRPEPPKNLPGVAA
jgi:ATP-binding cassette subfamily C protein/ATP-binding cassette subfamily C protein EexD